MCTQFKEIWLTVEVPPLADNDDAASSNPVPRSPCSEPSSEPETAGKLFHKDLGNHGNRHSSTLQILGMWNLARVIRFLGTIEQCVKFSEENELIATSKMCKTHRTPMRIAKGATKSFGSWVCSRGNCKMKSKVSRIANTFFENIKIFLPTVYYLIYAFAHQWSYDQTILEDPYKDLKNQKLSHATICSWYNHCRECVVYYQINMASHSGKIGGPGKIVQIDEAKFGKRKHNKGHQVEGNCVLGMTESGSEDLRIEVCPGNLCTAEVLMPLIQKHVEEGTTIHTNNWEAYDSLADYGYIHNKFHHSDPKNPFVAPDGSHSQHTQSQWKAVKKFFHKENYNSTENFGDAVCEYVWRRTNSKLKKDPFIEIIRSIHYTYNKKSVECKSSSSPEQT